MPEYIVDRSVDRSGDHVVHDRASIWGCLPIEGDRRELGAHDSAAGAARLASVFYAEVNGCARCSVSIRTSRSGVSAPAAARG